MHNFAKWPKKQRKTRHELNETHNSMSVLFMVCASNNFQINHQLSFEYEKKQFSYDDIHRHSKIHYGICLYSANVNWVLVFFFFFPSFYFVSSYSLWFALCLVFAHTNDVQSVHYLFRSSSVAVAVGMFSMEKVYTYLYVSPCIDLSHTENPPSLCRPFCQWFTVAPTTALWLPTFSPKQMIFSRFFSLLLLNTDLKNC